MRKKNASIGVLGGGDQREDASPLKLFIGKMLPTKPIPPLSSYLPLKTAIIVMVKLNRNHSSIQNTKFRISLYLVDWFEKKHSNFLSFIKRRMLQLYFIKPDYSSPTCSILLLQSMLSQDELYSLLYILEWVMTGLILIQLYYDHVLYLLFLLHFHVTIRILQDKVYCCLGNNWIILHKLFVCIVMKYHWNL